MVDNGYVVKDIVTNEFYSGMNHWDIQLRKAKIYHSIKYADEIRNDPRFSDRNMDIVSVEIKEF